MPAQYVESAQVPGFDDIRAWGDDDHDILRTWLEQRGERERANLNLPQHQSLPSEAYLAISGGGQDGAFSAGLLCGWTLRGDRPDFRIVTGVSAGALVAPFAFVGSEYDHVLREVFTQISTEDVARPRYLLSALTGEALYHSAPLRALLQRHVDDEFLGRVAEEYRKGRNLFIATTNLDAQRPVIWAMGKLAASGHPDAPQLFRDIMLASASIPGVFRPVLIDVSWNGETYQEMHVDGGATSQVFLFPATFDFRDFAESVGGIAGRTVYVVRNASARPVHKPVSRRTLEIARAAVGSLIRSQGEGDLYRIYLLAERDGIAFRLAAIPSDIGVEPKEMFDKAYMNALFDRGFELAVSGYPWKTYPPGYVAGRGAGTESAPSISGAGGEVPARESTSR